MAGPQKIISFFQHHFFLTLLVVFGAVWFVNQDQPIHPYPRAEMYAGNMNYPMDGVASMDMDYEESAAPSMMKRVMNTGGSMMSESMIAYADDGFDPNAAEQKIIKNGSLNVEVEDTEDAKVKVEQKVKEMGGFVTNLNSWEQRPGVLSYNFTLRIPAGKLDATLVAMSALGTKKSESINVRDITAQYTDNEARIANLEARRERLRAMMDRETENLADVLQIDRELSNVQQEIEQLERTQRGNDNDIQYSTLNLSIQPEPQIGDISNPQWSAKRTWKTTVNDFIESLQGLADKGIWLVVFAPIWIPALIILWFIRKKFFINKK